VAHSAPRDKRARKWGGATLLQRANRGARLARTATVLRKRSRQRRPGRRHRSGHNAVAPGAPGLFPRFRSRFHSERNSEQLRGTETALDSRIRPERVVFLRSHNPKVAGSNPAPAIGKPPLCGGFLLAGRLRDARDQRPGQHLAGVVSRGDRTLWSGNARAGAPERRRAARDRAVDRATSAARSMSSRSGYSGRARGEVEQNDSAVDLLVITRGDPERDRRRAWALIDEVARELGADPAVYGATHMGSLLARESRRDPVLLHADDLGAPAPRSRVAVLSVMRRPPLGSGPPRSRGRDAATP
jgi:hypothetical protein